LKPKEKENAEPEAAFADTDGQAIAIADGKTLLSDGAGDKAKTLATGKRCSSELAGQAGPATDVRQHAGDEEPHSYKQENEPERTLLY
jgi:hypothetical protein